MTRLSRNPLSLDIWDQVKEEFYLLITQLSGQKEIDDFLDGFLTPTEKVMLPKRFAIAVMLTNGYEYLEICQILKVSRSTVFSVQLSLRRSGAYQKAINTVLQNQKIKDFFAQLPEKLAMFMPPKATFDSRGKAQFLNPDFQDFSKINLEHIRAKTKVWETAQKPRD